MNNIPELVKVENVTKRFGGVVALDDVTLSVAKGEVHAIVGENGAGKSTLMKILAGVHTPDQGHVLYKGRPARLENPRRARELGISIVFQELSLFPELSVSGNIFVNREEQGRFGLLDRRAMRRHARDVLNQMGVTINPRAKVGGLPVGERQIVEISRALSEDAELLILDEPNSALTDEETRVLFKIIRGLKSRGVTIIYVSHRLEEVFQIADRVTVLRDGHYVGTKPIASTTIAETISRMIGRKLSSVYPSRRPPQDEEPVLQVKGLAKSAHLAPLDFEVRKGEIVGLAGLQGSGVETLFRLLFGLEDEDGGEIVYKGEPRQIDSASDAIQTGWGLIPADRQAYGALVDWSLLKNLTLVILDRIRTRTGLINQREAHKTAQRFIEKLSIETSSPHKRVSDLSGGNQQKVVLGKWLAATPELLLLDDPTRGIDVGTKSEIYRLMNDLSAEGVAMLFTSSELDEIIGMCDRIIVLYKGRKVYECSPTGICKEDLLGYVNGARLADSEQPRGAPQVA
jgi:ABC-type sugar transport system ATPase subunit